MFADMFTDMFACMFIEPFVDMVVDLGLPESHLRTRQQKERRPGQFIESQTGQRPNTTAPRGALKAKDVEDAEHR